MNLSCKGKVLISTPDASRDLFYRSVVLIVEHDQNGALGYILNKKFSKQIRPIKISNFFQFELQCGGPVDVTKFSIIGKNPPVTNDFIPINNTHYLTADWDTVIQSISDGDTMLIDYKIFYGHSSWAPMQLDYEIQNKLWIVIDTNFDFTLQADEHLWKEMMAGLGGEYLIWANAPDEISHN